MKKLIILLLFIPILSYTQSTKFSYVSNENVITIANSKSTYITDKSKYYFVITWWKSLGKGNIWVSKNQIYNESETKWKYDIYSMFNKDGNAIYYIEHNGIFCTYKLDLLSAKTSITESRYDKANNVVKKIIYYLE